MRPTGSVFSVLFAVALLAVLAHLDAAQHLVLWASPGVLKQLAAYRRLNAGSDSTDHAMGPAIDKVLREMRSDLGQNNLGLGEGQLLELLLSDVGNAAPEAVKELNTNGKP